MMSERKKLLLQILDPKTRESTLEAYVHNSHNKLYLQTVIDVDFEIIPFSRINRYLNLQVDSIITHSRERELKVFPSNSYYTQADIEKEVLCYEELLRTRRVISSSDWISLTYNPVGNPVTL